MPDVAAKCFDLKIQICFEHATWNSASVFGFSEYISALALLLVIYTASDFTYKYRLFLTRLNTRKLALIASFVVGVLLLLVDAWFINGWWIPSILNDENNARLLLAASFLALVFYLNYIVLLSPPVFSKGNAESYFRAMHHFVAKGNPDQLAVIAEALTASAKNMMEIAAQLDRTRNSEEKAPPTPQDYAHWSLLLLGSKKLCREMVDKSPWTVAEFFRCATVHRNSQLPLSQFARNVGSELVSNPNSALYSEDDGYTSGFLGYTKPISKTVYGDFNLVEALATNGCSPLDIDLDVKFGLTSEQLGAYARAALIFGESYFKEKNLHHSYAFMRMMSVFESAVGDARNLDGKEGDLWTDEYEQLRVTVDFVKDLVKLLEKRDPPTSFRRHDNWDDINPIYDRIAELIFEIIFATSYISRPPWTCWQLQHNAVWAKFFSCENSVQWKIVRHKVRRLLYDQAMRMKTFPNFKAARVVGYCLNVLGLSEKRSTGEDRQSDGLRLLILRWVKNNYLQLVEDHPKVAEACLQGSISFDVKRNRIVKTYMDERGKEPRKHYLALNRPQSGNAPTSLEPVS